MDNIEFPSHEPQRLSVDDTTSYMYELLRRGFEVTKDSSRPLFYLRATDEITLRISSHNDGAQVQVLRWGDMYTWADVNSLKGLQGRISSYLDTFADIELSTWRPKSIRLKKGQPASNMNKLASLLTDETLTAYFDPYLDNKSLTNLADIVSLTANGKFADDFRLISSPNMNKQSTNKPMRLSESFVEKWFLEHGVSGGGARLTQKEHRRFLLLASGRTIVIPFSLNEVNINEASQVEENNHNDDIEFFDKQWTSAEPLAN